MIDSTRDTDSSRPAELIAQAFHTEIEAAWFYQMMAEMTSDQETRDTLMTLARDEESHAETLRNLHFEITGRGIAERVLSRAEGDPDLFDFPSASRRDALLFALRNETKAADFYQTQANTSNNQRVATIFRLLADTERDHAAYMQLQLDRLDEPDANSS